MVLASDAPLLALEDTLVAAVPSPAVEHDVVPYGLVAGNRAHLLGLNIIGLRRANHTNEAIKDFKTVFNKIFNSNEIKTESIANNNTRNELTKNLVEFIQADSSRGLCTFK